MPALQNHPRGSTKTGNPGGPVFVLPLADYFAYSTRTISPPISSPVWPGFIRWEQLSGKELPLTPTEYRLLAYLAHNVGRVLTQDLLLEHVWGVDYLGESHILQVNMNRLRRKVEADPAHPRYLKTKVGIGYLLVKPAPAEHAQDE